MTLHFTPTYSSWLNQVELWCSADLARKLRRYIDAYAKRAKPFRWKHADPHAPRPSWKPISRTVH